MPGDPLLIEASSSFWDQSVCAGGGKGGKPGSQGQRTRLLAGVCGDPLLIQDDAFLGVKNFEVACSTLACVSTGINKKLDIHTFILCMRSWHLLSIVASVGVGVAETRLQQKNNINITIAFGDS